MHHASIFAALTVPLWLENNTLSGSASCRTDGTHTNCTTIPDTANRQTSARSTRISRLSHILAPRPSPGTVVTGRRVVVTNSHRAPSEAASQAYRPRHSLDRALTLRLPGLSRMVGGGACRLRPCPPPWLGPAGHSSVPILKAGPAVTRFPTGGRPKHSTTPKRFTIDHLRLPDFRSMGMARPRTPTLHDQGKL